MDRIRRPFEVTMPLVIRTYDIDFAGIVSNIVYIRWLEDLRLLILDAYLPLQEQIAQGRVPVLAETNIKYRRPLRLFDNAVAYMWVAAVGGVRWTLQAEIVLNGEMMTTATQIVAFIDTQTMRPVPPPGDLVERFRAEQALYNQLTAPPNAHTAS